VANIQHPEYQLLCGTLEEALEKHGVPEIFNTDQGSQFTSEDFTGVLKSKGIRISMDVQGRWLDNVFVEGLWRSVEHEEWCLHAYDDIAMTRRSLVRYFEFYIGERRHEALDRRTSAGVDYESAANLRHSPGKHFSCCPIYGVHFWVRRGK
jgi:putative transposase